MLCRARCPNEKTVSLVKTSTDKEKGHINANFADENLLRNKTLGITYSQRIVSVSILQFFLCPGRISGAYNIIYL